MGATIFLTDERMKPAMPITPDMYAIYVAMKCPVCNNGIRHSILAEKYYPRLIECKTCGYDFKISSKEVCRLHEITKTKYNNIVTPIELSSYKDLEGTLKDGVPRKSKQEILNNYKEAKKKSTRFSIIGIIVCFIIVIIFGSMCSSMFPSSSSSEYEKLSMDDKMFLDTHPDFKRGWESKNSW